MPVATKIKPITGMYKRMVVTHISTSIGLGVAAGYFWWYGYHIPAVRRRDRFYAKLEEERIRGMGGDLDL
ncbi:MAG: hypothetical protein M1831_005629 [Alyxoria varia]|nr:MAG: hypothetical protein M1831_005629 [Alyxoria varia]